MNERIKQLVKQSQPKIDWEARHYGELNNGEKLDYQNQWFEKFAELIVAECLAVCAVNTDDEPLDYKRGVIFAMNRCQQNIKEHFGVEE